MISNIVVTLVKNNVFDKNTIVTAKYQTRDLFGRTFNQIGDFRIQNVIREDENVIFELVSLESASDLVIRREPSHILAVDGMNIARFADVYNLKIDGSVKKTGKKRGRKPKTTCL